MYARIAPAHGLEHIVECYWMVQSIDPTVHTEKIIPDGFTELIFHLGDPYRIQLDGRWQSQPRQLLAGQITRHFFLENTGVSDIVAVKLRPAALTHLYGLQLSDFTDKVVDLYEVLEEQLSEVGEALGRSVGQEERVAVLDAYFLRLSLTAKDTAVDRAIDWIFARNGMTTVKDACGIAGVGERQLENLFKRYVGLSPKFFMRILRFNYIFQLIGQNNDSWCGLAYEAAYFDQSHFIRNFRSFTGVSPSEYAFMEENMANFFLRKLPRGGGERKPAGDGGERNPLRDGA